MAAPGLISRKAICMDYFSRKPDFPTFEDIYIARAQGALELERRGDEVACRFGPDGPTIMLPRSASRGDINRGCLACDGIVGALRENAGMRSAAAGWLDSYFTEVADRPPPGRPAAPTAFSHAMSISTASTRSAPGTRTGCAPTATRWGSAGTTARSTTSRASPSSRWSAAVRGRGRFPHPIRRGARYRGFRRHARTHVGARRGRRREGVDLRLRLLLVRDRRTDFSRARGHFPDATVAAWAAARSVNQSDGSMGFKERM